MSSLTNTTHKQQTDTTLGPEYFKLRRKTIVISYRTWLRLQQHMSYNSTFESAVKELSDYKEGNIGGQPEGA
jgi:hypothetical protein